MKRKGRSSIGVLVAIAMSALNTVFRVALYRYATDGEPPQGFEQFDLGSAFPPKSGRRMLG